MKNPYGNFFIQSPSRNNFFTRGESVSSNQKSAVKMTLSVRNAFMLLLRLFNLHSQKFVDGIHKFTLVFSQTSYINHRKWCKGQVESSSRLSLKINPLKITYRNSRIKTLGQKPDETLACLANSLEETRQTRKLEEIKPDELNKYLYEKMARIMNHQALEGSFQVLTGFNVWKFEANNFKNKARM